MRYYFPFKVYICSDSAGSNVIATIGNYVGWACTGTLTQRYSSINASEDWITTVISEFDDTSNIAGAMTSYAGYYSNISTMYNTLIKSIYLLLRYDMSAYAGNYIKLVSTVNDYYAISISTINSTTGTLQLSSYKLYDDSGNYKGELTSGFTGSANNANPLSAFNNTVYLCNITVNDSGDITGNNSAIEFTYTSGYAATYTSLRVRSISAWTTGALEWLNATKIRALESDPYAEGGTSETGGGTGTFDLTSDAIDFPALPTLTAVSTGLVSVYTPTVTQLNDLASYLWNANVTTVDWWKKLVANPLDLILGLSIVPVSVPAGTTQNVKVGLIDTGVAITKASTQFVTVDCGSINIAEYWGSALDYSPFTKFSIYLPFIGTRTLSTDDVMAKTIQVKYNIDLLSGACTAMVKCGSSVLYQYSGACAISLPLTGETFTNMITSTIQLAASVGATVASGGAAAGVTAASAANSVMSMKPHVERAGGVSGAAGQLGVMTPYLIAEVPRQSVPARYNTFAGYPSNITATLGDLSGYTEVETIYLQGIAATKAELDELETILKDGVIL